MCEEQNPGYSIKSHKLHQDSESEKNSCSLSKGNN